MNQRAFSILIFLILAAAMLTQCSTSQPEERNATLAGVADDGTPLAQLFGAACTGSIDDMSAAVWRGADVNARNNFTWTPLMMAVFYDQENSVRWLMKHGANVNESSDTGITPLLEAARVGDSQIMDGLIDAGGDIHAADIGGRNALICATESLHGATVLCDLLSRGLAPDSCDDDGQTPLMVAASGGNLPVASILIAAGADIHAKNHIGQTPFDQACAAHDDQMIAFLSSCSSQPIPPN